MQQKLELLHRINIATLHFNDLYCLFGPSVDQERRRRRNEVDCHLVIVEKGMRNMETGKKGEEKIKGKRVDRKKKMKKKSRNTRKKDGRRSI